MSVHTSSCLSEPYIKPVDHLDIYTKKDLWKVNKKPLKMLLSFTKLLYLQIVFR